METEKYESIKSKILKLQALAEHGVGGEAANAQRAIETLLSKYGLTLDEILRDDSLKTYGFSVTGKREIVLFRQCVGVVQNSWRPEILSIRGDNKRLYVKLNKMQFAELSAMYDWHRRNANLEFQRMVGSFDDAYISKHNIYPEKENEHTDHSEIDIEKLKRIMAMRNAMSDQRFKKPIGDGRKALTE